MMALTIFSLILGAVLGLRFNVFVLIPVIISELIVVTIEGIVQGADVWLVVAAIIAASTALQLGYLGSAVMLSWAISTRPFFGASWQTAVVRPQSQLALEYVEAKNALRPISASLGERLQWHYLPVLHEPIPAHLMALVQRL
jgi:hypothetical protein